MKFLVNWTIDLTKLPTYRKFSGEFHEELDQQLLKNQLAIQEHLAKFLLQMVLVDGHGEQQMLVELKVYKHLKRIQVLHDTLHF